MYGSLTYCGKLQKKANCGVGVGNCVQNLIFTNLPFVAGGGLAHGHQGGHRPEGHVPGKLHPVSGDIGDQPDGDGVIYVNVLAE